MKIRQSDLALAAATILCFAVVLCVFRLNADEQKDKNCAYATDMDEPGNEMHYVRAWAEDDGYIWYKQDGTGLLYRTPTGSAMDAKPVMTPEGDHLSYDVWLSTKGGTEK